MAASFSVPALGKGSFASFVKGALEVVWVLLWIGAAVLVLAVLVYTAALIAVQTGIAPADLLEGGGRTLQFGPVTVQADGNEEYSLPLMAPAFLAAAVALAGSLVIVLRLRRLFKNFTSGEPFSADNASHLRVIWITMLVMELSRYAIAVAVAALIAIFGQPETTEVSLEARVNLMTWGAIFILIVLAEVFREGARLKEEQELTI